VGELFDLPSRAHMLDLLHAFTTAGGGPLRFGTLEAELESR